MTGYVFSDRAGETLHGQLVGYLADMLDEHSMDVLAQDATPGDRALVVGAGASKVPGWLADRAGAEVVAVDIEPGNMPLAAGVTVQRLDITTDPIPDEQDLIHARAVLTHLPARRAVLGKLANALVPGGVLVVEEFDPAWPVRVLSSPDPDADQLVAAYQAALMSTMRSAGTSTTWARELSGAMETAGLVDVEASWWATRWRGGSAGCMLPHTMLEHRRVELLEAGLAEPYIARLRELLVDPRLVITNTAIVTAVGHQKAHQ